MLILVDEGPLDVKRFRLYEVSYCGDMLTHTSVNPPNLYSDFWHRKPVNPAETFQGCIHISVTWGSTSWRFLLIANVLHNITRSRPSVTTVGSPLGPSGWFSRRLHRTVNAYVRSWRTSCEIYVGAVLAMKDFTVLYGVELGWSKSVWEDAWWGEESGNVGVTGWLIDRWIARLLKITAYSEAFEACRFGGSVLRAFVIWYLSYFRTVRRSIEILWSDGGSPYEFASGWCIWGCYKVKERNSKYICTTFESTMVCRTTSEFR